MTKSEQLCNEIGQKCFSDDFVYENLQYINDVKNKCELCDALFEYADIYLVVQIKERGSSAGKNEQDWLNEVVFGKAVEQISATIHAINSFEIQVNNKYHQPVKLHKNNVIVPLIVFDNDLIKEYKKVVKINNYKVNVLSLSDYKEMMNAIVLPYDIFRYLQERAKWFESNTSFPHIALSENENSTIISRIRNEKDFANFYEMNFHDGDSEKYKDALRLLTIIKNFKSKLIKKSDYRQILLILQLIKPDNASDFMERYNYAWSKACDNTFDYSKAIQLIYNGKKTSIIFFAVGLTPFSNPRFYEVLCDAKQQQQCSDNILLISFIGETNGSCQIDWIYYSKEFVSDPDALKFYEEIGTFNGAIDRELYEDLCHKLLGE